MLTEHAGAAGGAQFSFSYSHNSNADPQPGAIDHNVWRIKTTEFSPDGNSNVVYVNEFGQPMLKVFQDADTGDQDASAVTRRPGLCARDGRRHSQQQRHRRRDVQQMRRKRRRCIVMLPPRG